MSTSINNFINLSLSGPRVKTGQLYLFLEGTPTSKLNKNINLSLNGSHSGTSFIFKSCNLFLLCDKPTAKLNLFLQGSNPKKSINNNLYLYLKNKPNSTDNNINLYITGGYGFGKYISRSINFYIKGSGKTPNSIPINSNLYLFLKSSNGINNSINLYLKTKGVINQNINLYCFGVKGQINNLINLYLHGKTSISNLINLFIRGF